MTGRLVAALLCAGLLFVGSCKAPCQKLAEAICKTQNIDAETCTKAREQAKSRSAVDSRRCEETLRNL